MAPSNGTTSTAPCNGTLVPRPMRQSGSSPSPPIGSKNPYSYRYLGKNQPTGFFFFAVSFPNLLKLDVKNPPEFPPRCFPNCALPPWKVGSISSKVQVEPSPSPNWTPTALPSISNSNIITKEFLGENTRLGDPEKKKTR